MISFFSKPSSVFKLLKQFETDTFPFETETIKTTVQIGKVRYRGCTKLFITESGFYLNIDWVFKKYPTAFIPWEAIRSAGREKLFGRRAVQLDFVDASLPFVRLYEADLKRSGIYKELDVFKSISNF